MTDEGFWQLIGRAGEQPGDRDEQGEWLAEELTRLPVAQVVEFAVRLAGVAARADSPGMRLATRIVHDGFCADETFHSFRLWLLSLGREDFERVVADPEELAGVRAVRELAARPMREWAARDWPQWEALDYAAHDAHLELTGRECGLEADVAEVACLPAPRPVVDPPSLPRLAALFAADRPMSRIGHEQE